MSLFPGPANPVVYAQFVIQGRWRRMLIVAGIYGALVGGLMWLSTLASQHITRSDAMMYLAILTGLQVLNLLLFGSFRVESAVRGDISSRMIESHRLMPTSPFASIIGYLFGAPLQVTLLAMVNFGLGAICCFAGGLPIEPWIAANGLLYLLALVVYAIVMQFAFLIRGGFLILLIGGLILVPSSASGALQVIPSLNTLFFPFFSRESVFVQMFNGSTVRNSQLLVDFGCAFAGWAIIAAVAIRVGIRRYLSSSTVGSALLGLILLATWVGLTIVGVQRPVVIDYRFRNLLEREVFVPQVVCALATTMLLAMFPIASAARAARQMRNRDDAASRHPLAKFPEVWTILAAMLLCGVLLAVLNNQYGKYFTPLPVDPIVPTAIIFINFFVLIGCFFEHGYLRRGRPWIIVSLWVPITWVGPVIADAIYRGINDNNADATALTAFSPPGAIAILWSGIRVETQPGIFAQLLLTLVPFGFLMLVWRKRKGPAIKA